MNTNRVAMYTRRITPECINMGKSITTSGIILILISIALVIMLIISTVYNYQKSSSSSDDTTTTDGDTDSKTKTSGVLQIICTVLGVITLLVGIWHYIVGNNLVKCINESPSS